jgi:dTDP-glucose pyrophosphorylase
MLTIHIKSFSYKTGYPLSESDDGGGFVFDCRGILNPGRKNAYKYLTGCDLPVQDYLKKQTQIDEFLNHVFSTIDITIQNYLARAFENLQISFGCTGGQHRSVYSAIRTEAYIKSKYPEVTVKLTHTNSSNWNQTKSAALLSAGLGTRLKPFTDNHPKCLFEIAGKTLLQRNIEYLMVNGFAHIVINVHHFASQIEEFLEKNDNFGAHIEISKEDELLETGGGIWQMIEKGLLGSQDFLVYNSDILSDIPLDVLWSNHIENQNIATLAIKDRQTSRRLYFDETFQLCGWVNDAKGQEFIASNQPNLKKFAFSGIHILSAEIFENLGFQGKFSIVEVWLKAQKSKKIRGLLFNESQIIDVGKPENIEKAIEFVQSK